MTTIFPALPWEPYTKAVQAYEDLVAEHTQVGQDIARLRGMHPNGTWPDGEPRFSDGELAQAITDDDAAQARAMRSGDKDPGRKNTQRVAKALDEARNTERVLAQAVTQTEYAVHTLLADHQGDAQQAVADARQDAERRYSGAVDALQDARQGYHRAAWLATWAANPGHRFKEAIPPLKVPGISQANGEPLTLEPIIAALQAEITVPEPGRKVSHYRQSVVKDVAPDGKVRSEASLRIPVFADEVAPQRRGAGGMFIGGVPVYMDVPDGDE